MPNVSRMFPPFTSEYQTGRISFRMKRAKFGDMLPVAAGGHCALDRMVVTSRVKNIAERFAKMTLRVASTA